MDLLKFSTEDLQALKAGDLKGMSTEGLVELKRQQAPPSIAEQNLASLANQGPIDELMGAGRVALDVSKKLGNEVKAGVSGISDLVAGNGLDTSVKNIHRIEDDKPATTPAANLGAEVGSQFTPNQIALMAGLGGVADMAAPWVAGLMKGWGEKAALNAVGMIRSIADTLNVDLSGLAQFLLKPVQIGGETFAPIVKATSSTSTMLKNAESIQRAAGKQLEAVANAMDNAIVGAIAWAEENAAPKEVILELESLKPAIEELKEKAVGGLEDVAPDVLQKFDGILRSVEKFVGKQENGTMATAFSDLSTMKTKLGGLTNFRSQTENNLAMQQAYGVLAKTLSGAADKVGGDLAAEYENANAIYHQVTAVINALAGKETKFALKDLFAPGSGAFLGSIVGGLPGMIAGLGVGAIGQTFGRQMAAQGLTKAAPVVAGAIRAGARAIPVVGNAIAQGLSTSDEDK